jgi:hypothetical protein
MRSILNPLAIIHPFLTPVGKSLTHGFLSQFTCPKV